MIEAFKFYLPLTVLAGFAALVLFGELAFWTVYSFLAIYGAYDHDQRFN